MLLLHDDEGENSALLCAGPLDDLMLHRLNAVVLFRERAKTIGFNKIFAPLPFA